MIIFFTYRVFWSRSLIKVHADCVGNAGWCMLSVQMLKDMKKQLAELLHDLNFVASRNPRDPQSNIHSGEAGDAAFSGLYVCSCPFRGQ